MPRIGRAYALGLALGLMMFCGPASQAQVRDRPVVAQPIMASIAGRATILINEQEQPVRRARVTLTPDRGDAITTQTGTDGAFVVAELTAGTYRVLVEKPGFVERAAMEPLTLSRGETGRVTVTMVPGASISGRITLDTGEPIANVVVAVDRISAVTGEREVDVRATKTDDLGQFRLHTLSSGRYLLHAKSEVVNANVYVPGTIRPEDGQVIAVGAAQEIDGADLVLSSVPANGGRPPGGAEPSWPTSRPPIGTARIDGVVSWSDTGKQAVGVTVRAMVNGRWALTTTNLSGQFAFVNLGAGEYIIVAERAGTVGLDLGRPATRGQGVVVTVKDGEAAENVDVPVAPSRAIAGRVLDEFGDPVPGVKVIIGLRLFGFGRYVMGFINPSSNAWITDDRGRFRFSGLEPADYYLKTQTASDQLTELQAPSGFAPTFFDGAFEMAQAKPVPVTGGDANNVEVSLIPAPMAAVRGLVLNLAGQPYAGASVSTGSRGARTASNGSFVFRDLPAGPYTITAQTYESVGAIMVNLPPDSNDHPQSVVVPTRPFAKIGGRVRFEGDPPSGWQASTRLGYSTPDIEMTIAATFADDGSFEIQGPPNAGYFRATAPQGWKLESVTLEGQNVTDAPIDFTHDVKDLDVVFTNRVGALTGTARDGSKPAASAMVVLFPDDPARQAYPSRYISTARTQVTGAFTMSDLLQGSYFAVAAPLFLGDPDPAWLDRMRALATRVQIDEHAGTTVSLQVVR